MASERVSVPPGDWLQGPPACDETKVKVVHDSVRTVMYRLARNPRVRRFGEKYLRPWSFRSPPQFVIC